MAKIKITQPTFDKVNNKKYEVGTVLDLGASRNKRAVETNQAVWVDANEKIETPNVKKTKVTKAGSTIIETKNPK